MRTCPRIARPVILALSVLAFPLLGLPTEAKVLAPCHESMLLEFAPTVSTGKTQEQCIPVLWESRAFTSTWRITESADPAEAAVEPAVIPIPAPFLLLFSAIGGLYVLRQLGLRRRAGQRDTGLAG